MAQFQFQPFSAITSLELPHRVKRRKSHFEQLWSAPPQIADIGCSREDFSLGPISDVERSAVPVQALMSFADALQGMPALTGEFHHLLDELVRILMRIDTANTAAVTTSDQHDVDGLFMRFAENAFE